MAADRSARIAKLRAMAEQTDSPNEARTAKAKLAAMGVSINRPRQRPAKPPEPPLTWTKPHV